MYCLSFDLNFLITSSVAVYIAMDILRLNNTKIAIKNVFFEDK
jgi:hypothetical protein